MSEAGSTSWLNVADGPDRSGARRARILLPRLVGQHVVLDNGSSRCVVRGVRHRRPVDLEVSLRTALALAQEGVPTTVSRER